MEEKAKILKEICDTNFDSIEIYKTVLSYLYQNGFKNTQLCFESSAKQGANKIAIPKLNSNESQIITRHEKNNNFTELFESPIIGSTKTENLEIMNDTKQPNMKSKLKTKLLNKMSKGIKNIFGAKGNTINPNIRCPYSKPDSCLYILIIIQIQNKIQINFSKKVSQID